MAKNTANKSVAFRTGAQVFIANWRSVTCITCSAIGRWLFFWRNCRHSVQAAAENPLSIHQFA